MLETDQSPKTSAKTIYLKDYQPSQFSIDSVDLRFDLGDESTLVTVSLAFSKNTDKEFPLVLDGEKFKLISLQLDKKELDQDQYEQDDSSLTILSTPRSFTLTIETELEPHLNTELSGLYQSSGNFCTQCEAEGFRRITYFLDRPDVLSIYTTTITGDENKYPVMLSNGNFQDEGKTDDGKKWITWNDPHPKPSYLFALVAGDLEHINDCFTTSSGKEVELNIYTEAHNIDKCDHAMQALINSMKWDEQVYGREYDLDIYNIVAVDDFNMGAMENKGLNVFNSKYVLADQQTATDSDYQGIESVIGHEYFHNWSGNRVTCRDWFQLSLKEGFTVFRDQEFSGDMGSRAVKRIQDVQRLRNFQFKEDAGPMSHPVRPDSYQEINNFYTATIYEKGAEVIRMMHSLVGPTGFRKGTDLYFNTFDGHAVTTEDFVQCMEQANDANLSQFRLWYTQSGTPELVINQEYCKDSKQLTLTIKQHCPVTPGQKSKQPFLIPIKFALLDKNGKQLKQDTMILTQAEQSYEFDNLANQPVVSLLRGFSAPVKITFKQSPEELSLLAQHDNDGFVRWEACQRICLDLILPLIKTGKFNDNIYQQLEQTFCSLLDTEQGDKAITAEMLSLPSVSYLAEQLDNADPNQIYLARHQIKQMLANNLKSHFEVTYKGNQASAFSLDSGSMAQRALKNTALSYLVETGQYEIAQKQFQLANNMTDKFAAFSLIVHSDFADKQKVIDDFYQQYKSETLVLDKWFATQATQPQTDTLEKVQSLMAHANFALTNPNKVRSLIGAFASNLPVFHAGDGSGYRFLADNILELNTINPQIAARLMTCFSNWRGVRPELSEMMQTEVERIAAHKELKIDIREIAEKTLQS